MMQRIVSCDETGAYDGVNSHFSHF